MSLGLLACGGSTQPASQPDSGAADATSDVVSASDVVPQADVVDASAEAAPDVAAEASGPMITFAGSVVSSGPNGTYLSGAQVCVAQTTNCSTANSDGAFSLQVPADSQVAITIQRPGYTNILIPIVTTDQNQIGWEIGTLNAAQSTANYAALGATYPDSATAFLAVFAATSNGQAGYAGVTFQFTPFPAQGPGYLNAAGDVDADAGATETSTLGEGIAAFPPSVQEVTITYQPDTLACTPDFGGWPAQGVNEVLVPLLAGFETHVGQGCAP
jgi:hypothetical protein